MKLNQKAIDREQRIIKAINKLDRDRIHVLYFKYDLSFYNLYHNPLVLGTKLLSIFTRKPAIDHIGHISRFEYDRSKKHYRASIFEASLENGMTENDLVSRLRSMRGEVIIETLGRVDKEKARKFEDDYRGVAYSTSGALFSGLDVIFLDKSKKKMEGGFCSWLEVLFLEDQGYPIRLEGGNAAEVTPSDLYCLNIGKKRSFFKYNE